MLAACPRLNQNTMKASFITDYNDTPGVCALPFAWMPLEVIIDAYLQMIGEGKVEAVPDDRADYLVDELDSKWVDRLWVIHPYLQMQRGLSLPSSVLSLQSMRRCQKTAARAASLLTGWAHHGLTLPH